MVHPGGLPREQKSAIRGYFLSAGGRPHAARRSHRPPHHPGGAPLQRPDGSGGIRARSATWA